jgi:hypothetical protein
MRLPDLPGEPVSREYVMIPLNAYQMGNLIDALAQVAETGDWYGEFCDIIAVAMRKAALTELSSNPDKTYIRTNPRAFGHQASRVHR